MRSRMKVAAATLAAVCLATAAEAAPGFTTTDVNMRAGPDTVYPRVTVLPRGAQVDIAGCLDNQSWCDVSYGPYRGWVYGEYLGFDYQGRQVLVPEYAPVIGIPVVGFNFGNYWGSYYRGAPWWNQYNRWQYYNPRPRPGWGAPPPGNGPRPPNWWRHPGGYPNPGNPGRPPGGYPPGGPGGPGWHGQPGHPGQPGWNNGQPIRTIQPGQPVQPGQPGWQGGRPPRGQGGPPPNAQQPGQPGRQPGWQGQRPPQQGGGGPPPQQGGGRPPQGGQPQGGPPHQGGQPQGGPPQGRPPQGAPPQAAPAPQGGVQRTVCPAGVPCTTTVAPQ